MADVVLVAGAIANKYRNGGEAWVRLSWAAGLRRLGFDVVLVEQIAPANCAGADGGRAAPFQSCANRDYFRAVVERLGFGGRSALICTDEDSGTPATDGLPWRQVLDLAGSAALLVNISGHLTFPPLVSRVRRTAYVDIDPGFTQFWQADPATPFRVPPHDFYFTIGENIGSPDCPIPSGGIDWRLVRQPVVLDDWPAVPAAAVDAPGRFTTVASWRGAFGPVTAGGRTYGVKAHEFRKFLPLPGLAARAGGIGGMTPTFEVALDIHPADAKDADALRAQGWQLADPKAAAGDPDAFRRYVQGSAAEFSVAQGVYVDTNSGWFSDRTVRYLASGRPALVQETGFGRRLPVSEGLVSFRTPDEAAAGAGRILRDYPAHCRAARAVAEAYFDSDKVLGRFLDEVGIK